MPPLLPIVLGVLGFAARLLAPVLFNLVFSVIGEGVRKVARPHATGAPTLRTILGGAVSGGKVAADKTHDPASRLAALQALHAEGRLTDQRLAQLTAAIEKQSGR